MAIYIKKNNQIEQVTALMSNKTIKSIYVKQDGETKCVWGEGLEIPFYYPASPECPNIYEVDKVNAVTSERERILTNPQEEGIMSVYPGETLIIRFYSQWYQTSGSKIKQDNQTSYTTKTNSSEEYSFVVQAGQGAVRLETMLGAEKSASCTITAPDKTWGRGIDSFAINVISRKGIASSHTINENKTINLKYGDQVNVANIVYPNEGYNQPTILLNGFTNNRVEGLSLSVSVNRNPKEYSVVKQFTGQNVAWTASNMIGDKVYYDDEIMFNVVRIKGYDSPSVSITNGSSNASVTNIPHPKDSSVINEIGVSFVVKGAPVVTVQGGAEVAQTTITLNVTRTEHINNAQISVYNAYHDITQNMMVSSGSYSIYSRSIVQIIKTSRVTGYKPIYTNNQKSPATGSMTLHISEIKGIERTVVCSSAPSAWGGTIYEYISVKGGDDNYRDDDYAVSWGKTHTLYDGEYLTSRAHLTKTWANPTRRPILLKFTKGSQVVNEYYCCDRKRKSVTVSDFTITAHLENRQQVNTATGSATVSGFFGTDYVDFLDDLYYEAFCSYKDHSDFAYTQHTDRRCNITAKTDNYKGKSKNGNTGTAVYLSCRVQYENGKGRATGNLTVAKTYCKEGASLELIAYV